MPLQDHFRPPLSLRRHWHAFHNAWATILAIDLNHLLPPGFFAEVNVQFGSGAGPAWVPPAPAVVVPFALATDVVEVRVYHQEGGPALAGAVELVSPANKDRPAHREAFVSKCAAYLHEGVGLVMVDVVTERSGNLHDELTARLGAAVPPLGADLYAVAYQPTCTDHETRLAVWPAVLGLGQPLPPLPLWLRGGPCLRLDLEAAYERTREGYRLSGNGA